MKIVGTDLTRLDNSSGSTVVRMTSKLDWKMDNIDPLYCPVQYRIKLLDAQACSFSRS